MEVSFRVVLWLFLMMFLVSFALYYVSTYVDQQTLSKLVHADELFHTAEVNDTTISGHSQIANTFNRSHFIGTMPDSVKRIGLYHKDKLPDCDVTRDDTDTSVLDHCQLSDTSTHINLTEAITDMKDPPFSYQENYRNPCWYERIPTDFHSVYNSAASTCTMPQKKYVNETFQKIQATYQERFSESTWPWRLRCLPLVHLIGVEKSGTTDFHRTLIRHPDIIPSALSEATELGPNFWSRKMDVDRYLSVFDEAAEVLRQSRDEAGPTSKVYHSKIFLDIGRKTFFYHYDKKSDSPAHLIRHLTPKHDIKIVMMVRNPTDRLLSSYLFFGRRQSKTAANFHKEVSARVASFKTCLSSQPLSTCVRPDDRPYVPMTLGLGLYHEYLVRWLDVFPRLKVYRLEDYKRNRTLVMNDLMDYLGLSTFSADLEPEAPINQNRVKYIEMWNSTRQLLDEFYRPYNERLAELLKDKRFLFQD